MFTRSKTETEDRKAGDDLAIPLRPTPPVQQPRMPSPARPQPLPARVSETPAPDPTRRASAPGGEGDVRRLVVGREITLSGQITRCDQLVVEGSVEAHLTDCRRIDIADDGFFKGSATIEEAEIRGRFEGNLIVRKRLLIKSTGRVTGRIEYGQIEIECGGQIAGEIQAQPEPAKMASAAE